MRARPHPSSLVADPRHTAGMTLVEVCLALAVGAVVLLGVGAVWTATLGPLEALTGRAGAPAQLRAFQRAMAADFHAAPCCPAIPDTTPDWQPAAGQELPGSNLLRWDLPDATVSWRIRAGRSAPGHEILRAEGRDGAWTWRVVLRGVAAVTVSDPAPVAGESWIWWITPVARGEPEPTPARAVVLRALGEP